MFGLIAFTLCFKIWVTALAFCDLDFELKYDLDLDLSFIWLLRNDDWLIDHSCDLDFDPSCDHFTLAVTLILTQAVTLILSLAVTLILTHAVT